MNVLNQLIESRFAIYNGDSVEVLKGLPDDSVHYSIFSPPFSSLYVYSNSDRDMGNSSTDIEFWQHFKYLIAELYRVIMPGRLVSVHCMDLPLTKSRTGVIGMKDFPGDIIRAFQDAGFVMHSRVTIWKDPLIEATRTKALGLLHKQIVKDSAMCRMGAPDYIVTLRKPGDNPEPIAHPEGFTSFSVKRNLRESKELKDLRPIQFCLIKSKNTIRSLYIAIKYGADMLIPYGPISVKHIR